MFKRASAREIKRKDLITETRAEITNAEKPRAEGKGRSLKTEMKFQGERVDVVPSLAFIFQPGKATVGEMEAEKKRQRSRRTKRKKPMARTRSRWQRWQTLEISSEAER